VLAFAQREPVAGVCYDRRMTRALIAYGASLAALCVLDFAWLGFIARNFYQAQIGALLLAKPNWIAALAFYAVYAIGIVWFSVLPALDAAAWTKALAGGALFGLFAYATYDLSNLATLKGWSASVTFIDIAWGMFATAIASTAGWFAATAAER
jgi:uncharacterized membrane protein